MTITKRYDNINYYYTFEYYLHEQELDYTVLDFLSNNGIELGSLICFFDIIKNSVHNIITTNENNSHTLIRIAKCDHDINLISCGGTIFYNNYKFIISDVMDLISIEQLINITNSDVADYHSLHYNLLRLSATKTKEYLSLNLDSLILNNLRTLSIITTCEKVHCSKGSKITKSYIDKLDIKRLFPNLKIIYDRNYSIIYQRDIVK
jgi:hypothetical protein